MERNFDEIKFSNKLCRESKEILAYESNRKAKQIQSLEAYILHKTMELSRCSANSISGVFCFVFLDMLNQDNAVPATVLSCSFIFHLTLMFSRDWLHTCTETPTFVFRFAFLSIK